MSNDRVLNEIVAILNRAKGPLGIEDLQANLVPRKSRRSLQRHLSELRREGRVQVTGKGPGTRYHLENVASAAERAAVESGSLIPLSKSSREIRRAVTLPVEHRLPVGYRRVFLERYRPNESYYLSVTMRDRLRTVGGRESAARPAGTYARQILQRLLIDLSWNSSRLEGNTYSLLETKNLIAFGVEAQGKAAVDTQMLLNHKAAIEFLVSGAAEVGFNSHTVRNLHAILSDNLLSVPEACGRLRTIPVGIGASTYHPPEVPDLIVECFEQVLRTAEAIENPFEQAFFIMVHIPYLQPFEDVNKRVSRLAANIPFIRHNLCPLAFVDVPNDLYLEGMLGIYELNRIELLRDVFVWAYERSAARYSAIVESLGEPDPFRLRYRTKLAEIVADIVKSGLWGHAASTRISDWAQSHIPPADTSRFVESVLDELNGLHAGNFARYSIRPSEFERWYVLRG